MTKQEAHKVATKLGLTKRSSKEIFYRYKYGDKLILTTAVPKGKGTLHVENDFRQQLKLTRDQLALAIKCPFGSTDYVKHLASIGQITVPKSPAPEAQRGKKR